MRIERSSFDLMSDQGCGKGVHPLSSGTAPILTQPTNASFSVATGEAVDNGKPAFKEMNAIKVTRTAREAIPYYAEQLRAAIRAGDTWMVKSVGAKLDALEAQTVSSGFPLSWTMTTKEIPSILQNGRAQ